LDPELRVDAFGENPLLEESGSRRDCHGKIALDSILTCEDLPVVRAKIHEAFFAGPFTAADGVDDYAGLACRLDECRTCVNGDLPAVGLESYSKVLHLSYCVLRTSYAILNTQYAQLMISLFCAEFSSGPVSFCCPLCAYVSVLPFITPQTTKNVYRKNFQAFTIYGIMNGLKSKK
jgi:hypothetical protein